MSSPVYVKKYPEPAFCKREILRYAGAKSADSEVSRLLDACIEEAGKRLVYKVCYRVLPVEITEDGVCDFGVFRVHSQKLSANLAGSTSVILFAATVGVEIDRLIAKYGRLSPARALLMQALGSERIEALCDTFCSDMEGELNAGLRPRFSPGYADLPLSVQEQIFSVLDCSRLIGLSLSDSLLMSPSKSVTAFVAVDIGRKEQLKNKCSTCDNRDCNYRGAK